MGVQDHPSLRSRLVSVPVERTLLATGLFGALTGAMGVAFPPHTATGSVIAIPFLCYAVILLIVGLKLRNMRLFGRAALPDYSRSIGATNSLVRPVPRHRWWTGMSAARGLMMVLSVFLALLAVWLVYDHVETLLRMQRIHA